jgi:hypothetical protein
MGNVRSFQNSALILYGPHPEQLILPGLEHEGIKVGDKVKEKEYPHRTIGMIVGFEKDRQGILAKIKALKKIAWPWGYFLESNSDLWYCEDGEQFVYLWIGIEDIEVANGYSVEDLAEVLYPRHYHSVYEPKNWNFLNEEMQPICS